MHHSLLHFSGSTKGDYLKIWILEKTPSKVMRRFRWRLLTMIALLHCHFQIALLNKNLITFRLFRDLVFLYLIISFEAIVWILFTTVSTFQQDASRRQHVRSNKNCVYRYRQELK